MKSDVAQSLRRECARLPSMPGYDEDLLKAIARLPFHLIVSINPDTFLSDTFYKFGVKHRFSHYRKGNRPSDAVAPPTREEPLIYNLTGSVLEDESSILDYEDLFSLIGSSLGAAGLPAGFRSAMEKIRTYIFMGFNFEKWHTQLMLRILCGKVGYRKYAGPHELGADTRIFLTNQFKIEFWDPKEGVFYPFLSNRPPPTWIPTCKTPAGLFCGICWKNHWNWKKPTSSGKFRMRNTPRRWPVWRLSRTAVRRKTCLREQESETHAELVHFFQQKALAGTLWTAFKSSKITAGRQIFLVFDQFEEFFSYPPEAQVQFRQQLSELLYIRIPQAVRDQMTNLDRTTKSLLHSPLWVHALFAVRSDRMHLLNSLQEELPEILQNRYELKALSATQAEAAIVRPARLSNPSFLLKNPFEYEPVALKKILFELSKARETGQELEVQSPIEAFQLQIVCQTIEQNLIARTIQLHGAQPDLVTESDLPEFEQIYEQYYADKLTDLPADLDRRTAHILLEEELVIGEELADARRISMDKDLLKDTMLQNHHLVVSAELLAYLENKFLIRREIIGGRIHYEVIHDVLLPPILKSRDTTRRGSRKNGPPRWSKPSKWRPSNG